SASGTAGTRPWPPIWKSLSTSSPTPCSRREDGTSADTPPSSPSERSGDGHPWPPHEQIGNRTRIEAPLGPRFAYLVRLPTPCAGCKRRRRRPLQLAQEESAQADPALPVGRSTFVARRASSACEGETVLVGLDPEPIK